MNIKFHWLTASGETRCIIAPNFVKIRQFVARISRFFDFSRWRPLPSWISEILKFYWLTGFGETRCINVPNFVKIFHSIAELLYFFIFQYGSLYRFVETPRVTPVVARGSRVWIPGSLTNYVREFFSEPRTRVHV